MSQDNTVARAPPDTVRDSRRAADATPPKPIFLRRQANKQPRCHFILITILRHWLLRHIITIDYQ